MSEDYLVERQIEINAGHRVAISGASACKNLHGHIYRIIAACKGSLAPDGPQQGMVIDFTFLKEDMMREIHDCCDHAMLLGVNDPLVELFTSQDRLAAEIRPTVAQTGFCRLTDTAVGALYVLPMPPTAEVLAAHFYEKLREKVSTRTNARARLHQIRVFETATSMAAYPA